MRKSFLKVYLVLSWLAFLSILIQVFLAGVAIFQDYSYWEIHKSFALFKYIYIAMFIVGLVGKLPKNLIWLSIAIFAVANVQYYTAHGFLASLHVVIPFLIFWINLVLIRKAYEALKVQHSNGL
ncbi:hypothetical protein CIL05_18140 [Virgibacillus profundi]|uniref:Uncharacterized protein n=1 Tax=Virgibacillus profundi TaxID=2024555 RepID=A0A2A2IA83_9BACI|nr:DUF6220 domain-containing protein [Virgibacillus profundi]PAV28288.1 hypothetical protein CIL05_18140 [Virgibacillus profundi]PXY52592.1 hypothetical protein CIT14_17580 [Virgibacillus profundi]